MAIGELLRMNLVIAIGLGLMLFAASEAGAVLGESESSVSVSAGALKGSHKAAAATSTKFRVHEIESAGVKIREYVGPDQKVFAVTWRGMRQPDLETLFGSFFNEFTAADRQRGPRRAFREAVTTQSSRVTVVRSGRMRDIRGKAFIADLVPNGVNPMDLE